MQVFNAKTQKEENVEWTVDQNRELVATFKDGGFVKFPAGTTKGDLSKLLKTHKEANDGQEVISPEREAEMEAERRNADKLVAELNGNPMPKGQSNDTDSDNT